MDYDVTVRELLDGLVEAWQQGDAHRAAAYFAPDARYHEAGHEPIVGREAISAHFGRFFRDGPLWRFEVDEVVVQAGRAAVCYRFARKGEDGTWRERAGCAFLREHEGLVAVWREYQG